MKRFWTQGLNAATSPLLDTVSGIVKQKEKPVQQDYLRQNLSWHNYAPIILLRLPLESAKKLRWFDSADLNQIIRSHIREKKELIQLNNSLRQVIIEAGYAKEDMLDQELLARISEIDQTQIANEGNFQQVHFSIKEAEDSTGVYATLLVAAQQEVEVLKAASSRSSYIIDRTPSGDLSVKIELKVDEENEISPVQLDMNFNEGIQRLQAENAVLRRQLDSLKKTELSSEMVSRAQNMQLRAEEEAEEARSAASAAKEREKEAARELYDLQKKFRHLSDQHNKLIRDHKADIEKIKQGYNSKEVECRSLAQRNIALHTEIDDLITKVSALDALQTERSQLASKVKNLEEIVAELRVSADQGGHYRQITTEMEERVSQMEKELLLTTQNAGLLDKRLRDTQDKFDKERAQTDKLKKKIYSLTRPQQPDPQPEANQKLLADLQAKDQELAKAMDRSTDLEQKLQMEQNEKMKLLSDLSHLEDRFLNLERQNSSKIFQLKHQLSVANNELDSLKSYVSQLESQVQSLCTKLHVRPDPNLGFEDSVGGGTFHNASAMSDASNRTGLSAIDTLYLKNVLFKFIEATAKGKVAERDMLLIPVATLLGATSEEFSKLKEELKEYTGSSSKSMFSFWSQ